MDTLESRSLLRTHLDAALIRTDSQQLKSNTIGNLDLGRVYIQRRPSAQADDLSVLQVVFCFRKSRDLRSIQSSEPEANPNSIFSCLESVFQVQRWQSLAIMSNNSTVDITEFELIVPFTQGVPSSAEDAFYEFRIYVKYVENNLAEGLAFYVSPLRFFIVEQRSCGSDSDKKQMPAHTKQHISGKFDREFARRKPFVSIILFLLEAMILPGFWVAHVSC